MRLDELYRAARSRQSALTCLSYGPQRKTLYPGYFFCHGCDLLEDAIFHGSKRANREQRKYQCTAAHEDWSHPTTMVNEYRPNNDKSPTEHGIDKETGSDTHKSSSPTKSPVKKKTRQGQSSSAFVCTILGNDNSSADTDSYDGEEEMLRRCLFYDTPTCRRDQQEGIGGSGGGEQGGNANNQQHEIGSDNGSDAHDRFVLGDMMAYTEDLEERILFLSEHLQSTNDKIATLEAEIARLKANEVIRQNSATSNTTPGKQIRTREKFENSTTRKRRLDRENDHFSRDLSNLIHNFLTNSDLIANRRRFPTRRLAKIIMDSIISFGWTHSQIIETASMLDMTSKGTNTTNGCCVMGTDESYSLQESLLSLMNNKFRCRGNKSKATMLVDCIWDETFLDGEAQSCMVERVRRYMRRHVFTPSKILKAMDLAGFNLSLAGIEILRKVETGENKYSRGFLPSKSSILRAAAKVESSADELCPFKMIGRTFESSNSNGNDDTDFGEGFEFDVIKTTSTLFEAFGLMDDAKERSVELGLASDGAKLTHTISHVAAGLKFNDVGMRDPSTKRPLLLHEPDSLVQSRNLCFPLRVVIAKDNKTTLEGFRALYDMFNSGVVSDSLQCRPLRMSYPGDMKLQWGALDNGGAAKVKEQFCYICPCRSSTLHIPQDKANCILCRNKRTTASDGGDEDNEEVELQCYHYEFVSCPEVRGKLADELAVITAMIEGVPNVPEYEQHRNSQQQQMYVRLPGNPVIEGDMLDIDYRPDSTSAAATFSRQITDELASRSMNVTGPLHTRQQRLRKQLVEEKRIQDLQRMLRESEPRDKAMYLVLQAVVCILHLENRVGLKSIDSVLRSGLSNARQGKLEWINSNAIQKRQDKFIECITDIIQTKILGTYDAPSQWRFPLAEDGSMGSLSMDNNRTRAIINEFEMIIDVSFPDSDGNKSRLLRCFPRYRAALTILRKNTDYTPEEINAFQEHIDAWFCEWVSVYGKEGCTNYTHMLSSSHVMRYMQEWKCLYRYSQQGWEALNALIKAYFFRRTNRGGLTKNAVKKTKLLGIARWLQRRMMWYSGHGDALFALETPNCNQDDDDSDSSYQQESTTSDDEDNDVSSAETYSYDSENEMYSSNDEYNWK